MQSDINEMDVHPFLKEKLIDILERFHKVIFFSLSSCVKARLLSRGVNLPFSTPESRKRNLPIVRQHAKDFKRRSMHRHRRLKLHLMWAIVSRCVMVTASGALG